MALGPLDLFGHVQQVAYAPSHHADRVHGLSSADAVQYTVVRRVSRM
jgi:hypothetical protein